MALAAPPLRAPVPSVGSRVASWDTAVRPRAQESRPLLLAAAGGVASVLASRVASPRTHRKRTVMCVEIVDVDAEIISEMPASTKDAEKDAEPPEVDAAEAEAAAAVVDTVLQLAAKKGVPVRSRIMEYKAEPLRSPLASCGIPELGDGGSQATKLLVAGLRAKAGSEDRAEAAAAALCLMLGGLDEAHNLITPHTWGTPTTYGGPPKLGSTVFREAAYCHVIIHRMEGENLGEFGFGFSNSKYWLGQAFSMGSSQHEIFSQLREDAEGFVADCHDARCLLRTMGPKWEPLLFNKLCEDALLTEDPETMEFCKAVQLRELQLLFEHIMSVPEEAPAD